jgi:hypothetical protein
MLLKELVNKSVYGTIGYISSQDDLDLLEQYILYNLPVLKEYKQIIIATNYKNYPDLVEENTQLWKKYFPDCIILDSEVNRGHQIGTADLDNILVNYCKENNIEWLCKSANDVIIQGKILDKEIEEADFYFLMALGIAGMRQYDFNIESIIKDLFTPQTNFYFINISKIDKLIDENDNPTICEAILEKCVLRNNLKKYHLIPLEKHYKLVKFIYDNNIHDSSHKNILIEGICHYQYPNNPITEI